MDADVVQKARVARLIQLRLDYLFRAAWRSIAAERGYRFDNFLNTSSHGVIALRSHLHLQGV